MKSSSTLQKTIVILLQLIFVENSQASTIPPQLQTTPNNGGINTSFGLPVINLLRSQENTHKNHCYTLEEEPYLFFNTKTAYEYTRGDMYNDQLPDTCEPIQLWSLNRHGTRLPGPSEIARFSKLEVVLDQIKENHKAGKVDLCDEDYAFLSSWKWNNNITTSSANDLVERGFMDLKGIGMRLKNRFPNIINDTCGGKDYYFQHTITKRTQDSFESFIKGIFYDDCRVDAIKSDAIIKEYLHCKTWNEDNDIEKEFEIFIKSPEFEEMTKRVSKRLGFDVNLNASLLNTIYLECAFEKAWNIYERSKWCTIFTEEDLLILEYGWDLKTYYKSGYGREKENRQLGCPILKDLYTKLNNTINQGKESKATFYFSHSKALHQLLTCLNLYKDKEMLKGDNYKKHIHRRWQISNFGQFASSILFVLNRCTETEEPFQIEIYIGEHAEVLCSKGKLCSWTEFSQKFENAIAKCDLSFCGK